MENISTQHENEIEPLFSTEEDRKSFNDWYYSRIGGLKKPPSKFADHSCDAKYASHPPCTASYSHDDE